MPGAPHDDVTVPSICPQGAQRHGPSSARPRWGTQGLSFLVWRMGSLDSSWTSRQTGGVKTKLVAVVGKASHLSPAACSQPCVCPRGRVTAGAPSRCPCDLGQHRPGVLQFPYLPSGAVTGPGTSHGDGSTLKPCAHNVAGLIPEVVTVPTRFKEPGKFVAAGGSGLRAPGGRVLGLTGALGCSALTWNRPPPDYQPPTAPVGPRLCRDPCLMTASYEQGCGRVGCASGCPCQLLLVPEVEP